jgi:hypothetical protein
VQHTSCGHGAHAREGQLQQLGGVHACCQIAALVVHRAQVVPSASLPHARVGMLYALLVLVLQRCCCCCPLPLLLCALPLLLCALLLLLCQLLLLLLLLHPQITLVIQLLDAFLQLLQHHSADKSCCFCNSGKIAAARVPTTTEQSRCGAIKHCGVAILEQKLYSPL